MAPPNSHTSKHRHRQIRLALQTRYRRLYDELLKILIRVNPAGVHAMGRSDFAPEVASILGRLSDARVADDVEQIIVEELHRWYGRHRLTKLDLDRVADATIAICTAWNRFLSDIEY